MSDLNLQCAKLDRRHSLTMSVLTVCAWQEMLWADGFGEV